MTREILVDRRRSALATQGESASLKSGEIGSTRAAIAKAAAKHKNPFAWRRSK